MKVPQNDPNVPINPRNTTVSPLYTWPQSQTFGQFKNFKLNLLKTTLMLLKPFCHIRAELHHHCSSLWLIWPKIEFSWSGIRPNILPTICPCTRNFDDFQRMGKCDFRKTITCLKVVSGASNLLKSLFLWNDTTWHHFGSYFQNALQSSGWVRLTKVSYYWILEIFVYLENPICEAWASV